MTRARAVSQEEMGFRIHAELLRTEGGGFRAIGGIVASKEVFGQENSLSRRRGGSRKDAGIP